LSATSRLPDLVPAAAPTDFVLTNLTIIARDNLSIQSGDGQVGSLVGVAASATAHFDLFACIRPVIEANELELEFGKKNIIWFYSNVDIFKCNFDHDNL
jgi:hypothetical protein